MEKLLEVPQTFLRACGGWLAVSNTEEPLKIGVIAPTEDEAVTQYQAALRSWREILGQARI